LIFTVPHSWVYLESQKNLWIWTFEQHLNF
jgi:hypothetical protein